MRGAGKGWGSGAGPGTITGVETEAEVQPGPGGLPARAHRRGGGMCFSGRLFEQVEGISNTVNTGELDKTVRSYSSVRAALACTFRCAKTPANTVASGHERETWLNRWLFVVVPPLVLLLVDRLFFVFLSTITSMSYISSLTTFKLPFLPPINHHSTYLQSLSLSPSPFPLPNHWPYHRFLHSSCTPRPVLQHPTNPRFRHITATRPALPLPPGALTIKHYSSQSMSTTALLNSR